MIFLSNRKTKFKIYLCGPNDIGVKVSKIANEVVRIFKSKKKLFMEKPVMVGRVTFQIIIIMYLDLIKRVLNLKKHLFKLYKKLLDKINITY